MLVKAPGARALQTGMFWAGQCGDGVSWHRLEVSVQDRNVSGGGGHEAFTHILGDVFLHASWLEALLKTRRG